MKGKNTDKQLAAWPACLALAFCLGPVFLRAQPGASLGYGRSWGQLKAWVFEPAIPAGGFGPVAGAGQPPPAYPRFWKPAARWQINRTPPDLPFFCRIERRLNRKNRVLLKLRLGSADYVDWLEQKPCAKL